MKRHRGVNLPNDRVRVEWRTGRSATALVAFWCASSAMERASVAITPDELGLTLPPIHQLGATVAITAPVVAITMVSVVACVATDRGGWPWWKLALLVVGAALGQVVLSGALFVVMSMTLRAAVHRRVAGMEIPLGGLPFLLIAMRRSTWFVMETALPAEPRR